MPKTSQRKSKNDWGVIEMARERPVAAAAAAAGAAAAGLFVWSKRAQISDQLSQLSDQIGEWNSGGRQFEPGDDAAGLTTKRRSNAGRGRVRRQTPTA